MNQYNEAVRLMKKKTDLMDFAQGSSEDSIKNAEKKLGVIFPSIYKKFLREFGAGLFGGSQFYGVVESQTGESQDEDMLSVVGQTLYARKNYGLPNHLVLISELGNGAVYCLDCSKEKESPVIVYWSTFPREAQEYEIEAEGFGAFFLNQVQITLDANP
jgi:hypothetical protein